MKDFFYNSPLYMTTIPFILWIRIVLFVAEEAIYIVDYI